jgi:hypothetical protein
MFMVEPMLKGHHNIFKTIQAVAVLIIMAAALLSWFQKENGKPAVLQAPVWHTTLSLTPKTVPRIEDDELSSIYIGPFPLRFSIIGIEKEPVKLKVKILSGPQWVRMFPTSRSTADLRPDFRRSTDRFIAALRKAGANVKISATHRPQERAYLMHYSYKIAKGEIHPADVPEMEGVNIDWLYVDKWGRPDIRASKDAARRMVAGYVIAYRPALFSPHIFRKGIDMTISWEGDLDIKDARGKIVHITADPRTGNNPTLHTVGRSYGLIKFVPDPPHWNAPR